MERRMCGGAPSRGTGRKTVVTRVLLVTVLAGAAGTADAQRAISRISKGSDLIPGVSSGAQGTDESRGFANNQSADGRYVVFASAAANLVPDDTNGVSDVFVRDRQAGVTVRLSVSSAGLQANRQEQRGDHQSRWPFRGLRVGGHQSGRR
jgi:hypothetical protein